MVDGPIGYLCGSAMPRGMANRIARSMTLVALTKSPEMFVAPRYPVLVRDMLRVRAPSYLIERTLMVLRSVGGSVPATGSRAVGKSAVPDGVSANDSAAGSANPEIEVLAHANNQSNVGTNSDTNNTGIDQSGTDQSGTELSDAALSLTMEELVREHADAVYRVALSVTRDPTLAEDASQDALIKAWQALPSYRGEAPLRHWILRITHNVSISLLRRRREDATAPDELPDSVVMSHSVESQVEDRVAIDRFNQALKDLDPLSRSIVVLREVEGLSYAEIGDVLEVPLPTVRTRLLRARRQLAIALEGWRPG